MELIDKDALVEYLERMGNEIYPGNDEYFLGQKTGLMKVVGVVITFPAVEEREQGCWKNGNKKAALRPPSCFLNRVTDFRKVMYFDCDYIIPDI